jgi:cytochrome d ubiquinol oxidase subunit II
MLLLFALIFRGISFEFRSKVDSPGWRRIWDSCMIFGSLATTILLGVAFANLFKGLPITDQGTLQGGFFQLLNPYGLLGGIFFLIMFMLHGSLWLVIKSSGELAVRASRNVKRLWPVSLIISILFIYVTFTVTPANLNYSRYPVFWIIPFLGIAAVAAIKFFHSFNEWYAWFSSSAAIVLLVFTGIIGMYPNLIRSTLNSSYSMTIQNSSSSPLTLKIMLTVAVLCVPVVIIYQILVYKLFRHKLTAADLASDESY